MELVGTVSQLFRYGVKSMQGQEVERAEVIWNGLVSDRSWVVVNTEGVVITAKMKEGGPLLCCAVVAWVDDRPLIRFPNDKNYLAGDDVTNAMLTDLLGFKVRMRAVATKPTHIPTNYRPPFSLRPGVGVDSSPVHLLTTASLVAMRRLEPGSDFAVERFRPNALVIPTHAEGFVEDRWVGRVLQVGQAQLYGRRRTDRCPEPTQAQPGLPRDPNVLRAITQHHGKDLGIYLTVVRPGVIEVGDDVYIAN